MPKRALVHRPLGAPSPETAARMERERQKRVNERRDPAAAAPYKTKAWREFRAWYLRRNPLCVASGCREPARDVDHITPLAHGGAMLDEANVQSLCQRHHAAKTAAENRGTGGRFTRRA